MILLRQPARRSLHIGLNYPGTSAELAGCVNDARDWQAAAGGLGYDARVVLEPTGAQLLAELRAEVALARWGDRLLVTYSGHGTWLPDNSGDEPDGRDEALVPSDYRTGGLIVDDELLEVWAGLRYGVRAVFVSDSCHSGSVSREVEPLYGYSIGGQPHPTMPSYRSRFLSPAHVPGAGDSVALKRAAALPVAGKSRPSRVALLSGCADSEVSYDAVIDGRPRGAASWAYLTALANYREIAGPGVPPSLRSWHRLAADLLARSPYAAQHPQLLASTYQAAAWRL